MELLLENEHCSHRFGPTCVRAVSVLKTEALRSQMECHSCLCTQRQDLAILVSDTLCSFG